MAELRAAIVNKANLEMIKNDMPAKDREFYDDDQLDALTRRRRKWVYISWEPDEREKVSTVFTELSSIKRTYHLTEKFEDGRFTEIIHLRQYKYLMNTVPILEIKKDQHFKINEEGSIYTAESDPVIHTETLVRLKMIGYDTPLLVSPELRVWPVK